VGDDDVARLNVLSRDVAAPGLGHAALALAGLQLDVVGRVALLLGPLRAIGLGARALGVRSWSEQSQQRKQAGAAQQTILDAV